MLNMKYIGEKTEYKVSFNKIGNNVVQIKGNIPIKTNGFVLTRIGEPEAFTGDYSDYTTVYREINGGVQFSNDGSRYTPPEPTPEPEPYVPTLEEVQQRKISEMQAIQKETIQNGLDITLSDGTVEHFTLTNEDQTSLMGLQTRVLAGDEKIPWHDSNIETGCKYYSNADMEIITEKAMAFVTWHVTYFINLRVYILMLQEKEEVEAIEYGTYIPEEYQDEVMRDLYAIS